MGMKKRRDRNPPIVVEVMVKDTSKEGRANARNSSEQYNPIEWCLKCYTSALSNSILWTEREVHSCSMLSPSKKQHLRQLSNLAQIIDGHVLQSATYKEDIFSKTQTKDSKDDRIGKCVNFQLPATFSDYVPKPESDKRSNLDRDLSYIINGFYKVPPRTPATPAPLPNPFVKKHHDDSRSPREGERGRFMDRKARDQVRFFRANSKMKSASRINDQNKPAVRKLSEHSQQTRKNSRQTQKNSLG